MATAIAEGAGVESPILFANNAFLEATGLSREVILQRAICAVLSDLTDKKTVFSICTALEEGRGGSWEMQCRRTDGSEFLAVAFLSSIRQKNGIISHNVLSLVELSGRIERLIDQINEFHAIYEQAPGFIATYNGPDHCITFANAAYEKFVGRNNLVGLTVAEALPEMLAQGFIGLLDEVYRTGVPFVGRSMPMGILDSANGNLKNRFCDFVYQPVRDARGHITGLFCEGYDVTEQRGTADALTALQSEMIQVARVNTMGVMAATLAHELNQPLTAIANYAAGSLRMMDKGSGGGAGLTEALKGIEEASQRAGDIIRNLRELARGREPIRGEFDFKIAAEECVRLVKATAPGITMTKAIPEGLTISADRVQIQQVMINLLRNACDALDRSGPQQITITATIEQGSLTVSVTDTGRGVPSDTAKVIFASIETTKEGGMGLGLMISQAIIQSHHGRIWLESTGSEGSTFCFSLPPAAVVPSQI